MTLPVGKATRIMQICCCAVDLDLARILGRQDDQMVRELAASVEQLAKAVQTAPTADQAEDSRPRSPRSGYNRGFDGSALNFQTSSGRHRGQSSIRAKNLTLD